MQNALKPETSPVIYTLDKAAIRLVMVTGNKFLTNNIIHKGTILFNFYWFFLYIFLGDNLLTALSVARECGMITNNQVVVVNAYENDLDTPIIKYEKTGNRQNQAMISDNMVKRKKIINQTSL